MIVLPHKVMEYPQRMSELMGEARHIQILVLLVAPLLMACGDSSQTVTRERTLPGDDGIRTVEIPAADLVAPPQLELVESVRLGRDTTVYWFARVADVEVGAAGEIFVLDPVRSEVARFDSLGHFRGTFGGSGGGPGEFGNASYLALSPDTIYVYDRPLLHAFSREGEPLYAERVREQSRELTPYHDIDWGRDGLIAFRRTIDAEMEDGENFTDSIVVEERGAESEGFETTRIRLAGTTSHRRGSTYIVTLLAGSGAYSVTADGRIVYARGDTYDLDVLIPREGTVRRVRGHVQRHELSREERERFIDRLLAVRNEDDAHIPGRRGLSRRMLGSVPFAAAPAVVGRILAGDHGRILVERLDQGTDLPLRMWGAMSVWDVIDLDGTVYGRVTLPPGFTPLDFRGWKIYGAEQSGLVPTAVAYRISVE